MFYIFDLLEGPIFNFQKCLSKLGVNVVGALPIMRNYLTSYYDVATDAQQTETSFAFVIINARLE